VRVAQNYARTSHGGGLYSQLQRPGSGKPSASKFDVLHLAPDPVVEELVVHQQAGLELNAQVAIERRSPPLRLALAQHDQLRAVFFE
jgi:hypothetical protein